MKKFFIASFMMLFCITANAQFEPGTWSLQPKIGIGAAWINNDDMYYNMEKLDNMPTAAVLFGAELEYQAMRPLSFSAGVNFAQRGTAWDKYKDNGADIEDRLEMLYIDIPVKANLYFAKGWALKAGVQLGLNISASQKSHEEGKLNGKKYTVDTSLDVKDTYKDVEFSIPVGVSYEFKNHLVLDATYNIGLTDLSDIHGITGYKSGVFMLSCGYKFKL